VRARVGSALISILSILLIINVLYFTNAIPPLPLALKDSGVYHSVVRTKDGYIFKGEVHTWMDDLLRRAEFHLRTSTYDSAIVFTSIFAPTGFSTPITHEWQKYNDVTKVWETKQAITFSINGGRDGGYRGYSRKDDLTEGYWRVNVLTESDALIGRIYVHVIPVTEPAQMEEVTK
jgi:hypothetical protein